MTGQSPLNRRDLLKMGLGAAAGCLGTPAPAQDYARRAYDFGFYGEGGRIGGREPFARQNPILFWNDVSLKLVALDHSIDAMQSRAPGPCASARALGLVHIVMADAVAAVHPTDFDAFYVRREVPVGDNAEAFVGGAAAAILELYLQYAHSFAAYCL